MKTNILRPDYTTTGSVYQLVIPMDIGDLIPADDSVRLLSTALERMSPFCIGIKPKTDGEDYLYLAFRI